MSSTFAKFQFPRVSLHTWCIEAEMTLDIGAGNEVTWAMIKGQHGSLCKLPVTGPFSDWIIYLVHRMSVVCSSVTCILQYRAPDIQSKLVVD